MRQTLLEMVQAILAAMDSDEVNSINDTVESSQVALLIKNVYYDIAVDLDLKEHNTVFELEASGSSARPTYMTLPTNVTRLDTIKYNNMEASDTYSDYKGVSFMPFAEFLDAQNVLREQSSNVGQMSFVLDGLTFEVMYATDKQPEWYTQLKENVLLFDSYDRTLDTTLQKSKTLCEGAVYPVFSLADTFTPDLDPTQFSYLLNRAKVRAFNELKQAQNQEAASETRRQKIIVQKRKHRVPRESYFDTAPKFGRK